MLSALVEDFQRLADCEVSTLLDQQCPELGHDCVKAGSFDNDLFRRLASEADATLVIAPETDGILSQLSLAVIESGGTLLGCEPSAIDLCADKKALAELWQQLGVPTPETINPLEFPGFPVVLKPRDGAGSQATFLIRDRQSWQECWRQARAELPESDFLVQRFAVGQPASIAFLVGPAASGLVVPLMPAAQLLSADGRFHYLGGEVPLSPALARRAVELGQRAVGCVKGLLGYVGVDLILGADDDLAIEINPRLTTSYLGLRRLFQGNLAQAMWDVFLGRDVGALAWENGTVQFTNAGQLTLG